MRAKGRWGMDDGRGQSQTGQRGDADAMAASAVADNATRVELLAQLGELLYPATKDDEHFFLMAPELYLAIARIEDGRSADNATATF